MLERTTAMGGLFMLSLATWATAVALSVGAAARPIDATALLDAPARHVRTTDRALRAMLRTGYAHSPTFAALLARLERSDVYVYIEDVPRLPGALEGRLLVLPPTHGVRYVRIQIARRGTPNDTIAVLGHELRHAIEVADASGVLDTGGLMALYRQIGIDRGNNVFDTVEAQETGRQVLRELVA
jgi:hypothetical protein